MPSVQPQMPGMVKMMMLIALAFAVYGAYLEYSVAAEEVAFHDLQTEYFANHTKAERDNATTGSELNQQLARIHNYPSQLMYLKLGGIASILLGIFISLMGIFRALTMMPHKLADIIGKK